MINSTIMFIIMLIYYQLMTIIANYVINDLDISASLAGLIAGIFMVFALPARIISGKLIEEFGRKKMLHLGLVIYGLGTFSYFIAGNFAALFLIRIIQGLGFGVATTSAMTIAAGLIPDSRRGEGMGYFMLSITIASAIGPSLGIFFYQQGDFSLILVFSSILLVIGYFSLFFMEVPEVELSAEHLAEIKSFKLKKLFEFKVLPIAIVGAMTFFAYASIISFLSTYVDQINLVKAGSVFFLVYSMSMLVFRPLTGRWFDLKGKNYVMYPAFLAFAAGLIVISQAQTGLVLLFAAILMGFGFGTFSACGQTIAINSVPDHRVGIATSTFLAISEIGIGIGPFFLGMLIPKLGFRGLYLAMALVVILAMFLYYLFYGRK
ncbi:Predicted arabinose efflux permease, MFS family [Halanaerobium salsuginis]|uniref:Predicted arabinose efflux permease, MFS family n=2 Tax=Halanaerobium salsuginis TaxID=29563 RepID=A0A1I4NA00_9FIRM|nr:Predicted arabinose efflux permease, MFS family [Halanaerobium salsuginis]